jgi:hypothetical protein
MANYFDNTADQHVQRDAESPIIAEARQMIRQELERNAEQAIPVQQEAWDRRDRERELRNLRQFALQEANKYNSAPDTVVPRAEAYLDFLHGASNKPPVENPVEYEGTPDKGSPDLHDPQKLVEDRSVYEAGFEAGKLSATHVPYDQDNRTRGYNQAIDDVLALKRSNGLRGRDSVTVREVEAAVQSLRKG